LPEKTPSSRCFLLMNWGGLFRKILVVFQFAISIFLIVITSFINKQLNFIRNKDLEYDKDNIICLSNISGIAERYMTVKNTLLNNPNVTGMTRDFNMQSLHKQIESMVMRLGINLQRIAIKIKPDNVSATIGFIETEIKK
jgi:hypothetical protein